MHYRLPTLQYVLNVTVYMFLMLCVSYNSLV